MSRDDYELKRAEKEVAAMAYPAILPSKVKRMLAAKLVEIADNYTEAHRKYSAGTILPTERLEKIPAAAKRTIARITRARAAIKAAEDALKAQGFEQNYTGDQVCRVLTKEELEQKEAERRQRWHQIQEDQKIANEAFRKLVADLAEAQIQKERSKLPADLVARMDAIATPKLLGPAPSEEPETKQDESRAVEGEIVIPEKKRKR